MSVLTRLVRTRSGARAPGEVTAGGPPPPARRLSASIEGWPLAVIALAAYLVLPLTLSAYHLYLLDLVCVYVLVAVGLNIVMGVARQFALASAGFFGVGAYSSTLLIVKLGWPFWLGLPAAALLAGVAGALTSLAAWRVTGLYLAMVTFGFGEIVQFVLIHWDALTKGPDGLSVPRPAVAGFVFESERHIFWLYVPLTVAVVWAVRWLLAGRLGRALTALGDSEIALSALGLTPAYYKTVAFALSGACAGVGGVMFASVVGFIDPYTFGLQQTLLHLTMISVGGIGSLGGSVLGAGALTLLADVLRGAAGLQEIVYGAILLVVFIFCPGGLAPLLGRLAGGRRW